MARRAMPTATVVDRGEHYVRWRVTWPSSPQRWGETYLGDVDTATGEMSVLTAVRKMPASEAVAARIMPIMRAAIARSSEGSRQ